MSIDYPTAPKTDELFYGIFSGVVLRTNPMLDDGYSTNSPVNGVIITVTKPDDNTFDVITENNGFFLSMVSTKLSDTESTDYIDMPGTYKFQIKVPPKWTLLSEDLVQKVTFQPSSGHVRLEPENPLLPFYIAPDLYVAGKVKELIDDGSIIESSYNRFTLSLRHVDESEFTKVFADDHGNWEHPVKPGRYDLTLVSSDAPSTVHEYSFEVNSNPIRIADFILGEMHEQLGQHNLDVEDLVDPETNLIEGLNFMVLGGMGVKVENSMGSYNAGNTGKVIVPVSGTTLFIHPKAGRLITLSHIDIVSNVFYGENETLIVEAYGKNESRRHQFNLSSLTTTTLQLEIEHAERVVLKTKEGTPFVVTGIDIYTTSK